MKKFDKVTRIIYTIVYGVAILAIFLFWKFFVKNIFSPSVTDGINVKITNSFYTGSISSSSLIESVGNVKIV